MFPQPILAPWARLFASLALEAILVFALTALLARLIRPAAGQRMVWRVSFVVIAALVLAEFSGMGHSLLQRLRPSPPASVQQHTFVVTTSVPNGTLPASARVPTTATVQAVPAVNSQEKLLSSLALWLPAVALAGLVWFGARRSFGALRLIRLGRRAPSDSGDLSARVQSLGRRLGIRRHVRVKLIEGLSSPIAFGIVRPVVGVPKDFSALFTIAQQEAMLAHELAHVAALDAVWMLLADLVTALLWWHPGAWWARRHLRAASETAADEASLLLDDGPATLAECLVTLGDHLTRSPDPGGLGMAGFRFRSELGRRVERLLKLRGPTRHPWRCATAWLARLFVPAALLALALAFTAWLLPPAARAGTFGETFLRSPLGLATTALLTADKHRTPRLIYRGKQLHNVEQPYEDEANDASRLLLEGKQFYDTGKTNEAEAKWRAALELDPGNKDALDYLAKIGRTNSPAARAVVQPSDFPSARTNFVYTSTARQKIFQKLSTIRLDSVKLDAIPLSQALEIIKKDAKDRDPEKQGVNIILSTMADPQPAAEPEADITATTVKIDPELNDVTLGQVLDIIVKVADRPIKYTVEDYGVVFSLRGAENPVLHTSWFKIDPSRLLQGMKAVSASGFGTSNKVPVLGDLPYMGKFFRSDDETPIRPTRRLTGTGWMSSERGDFLTTPSSMEMVSASFRTYFETKGVVLNPPKSLIFNDRLGMLMVRATLQELDLIERAVAVLNTVPPQVEIEVKLCEVPEELLEAPGLRLKPSMTWTNGAGTNAASTTLTGILTPDQFRNVFKALEHRQGVKTLFLPRVLTVTDRQAQVKTVEVKTVVTGYDLSTNLPAEPGKPPEHPLTTETFEFGPVVDVVPSVAADRRAIIMTVVAGLKEIAGYDLDPSATGLWDYVESEGANPAPARPPPRPPRPVIRERQAIARATVWDGQTLVLASRELTLKTVKVHGLIELPAVLAKDLFRRQFGSKSAEKKVLLVFVTPTIVDPAGNAIHTDADIPERTNSVPSLQPPPFK